MPTKLNKFTITCPLCQEKTLQYRPQFNPQADVSSHATHIWVCSSCPAILMEYYHPNDLNKLNELLKKED